MKLKIYSFGGLLFFTFLMPLRASEKRGFDTSEIDTKAIKWRFDGKYTDLKKMVSDFVLETHRIEVPGYPYTFNPSIVRWNNRLLMSFRVNDLRIYSSKKIGLVWLDENFNPVGDPYILKIPRDTSINFFVNKRARIRVQDPRLITINDRLYIIYSDYQIGRMFKAELHFDGEQFFLDKADCFLYFENEKLITDFQEIPTELFRDIDVVINCAAIVHQQKKVGDTIYSKISYVYCSIGIYIKIIRRMV